MTAGILQAIAVMAAVLGLAWPLGWYIARVMDDERTPNELPLGRLLGSLARWRRCFLTALVLGAPVGRPLGRGRVKPHQRLGRAAARRHLSERSFGQLADKLQQLSRVRRSASVSGTCADIFATLAGG